MNSEILELTTFLAFDFSQAELRMLAEISGDALLIKQFQEAAADPGNPLKDIHCQVGHSMTGWDHIKIKESKSTRKVVKNIQFGLVFGKQKKGMYDYVVQKIREIDGEKADLTGITREFIEKCVDAYFARYKGVARYMKRMQEQVETDGYVDTLYGFRRQIFEDDARDTFMGNQAINTPVQGSAHQLLLIALALLHMKPKTYALLQNVLMEVHDALVFLVKVRDLPAAFLQGKHLLERGVVDYTERHFKRKLKVPLLAEAEAGFCYGTCVEYSGEPLDEWLAKWRKNHTDKEAEAWKKLLSAA